MPGACSSILVTEDKHAAWENPRTFAPPVQEVGQVAALVLCGEITPVGLQGDVWPGLKRSAELTGCGKTPGGPLQNRKSFFLWIS